VPAVAVIRKRLVLFIFNRFKGSVDGKLPSEIGYVFTRVLYEEASIHGGELKFCDPMTTGKGESNLLSNN